MQTLFFGFGFPYKFNFKWWKDLAFITIAVNAIFMPIASLAYGIAYVVDLPHFKYVSFLEMQFMSAVFASLLVCFLLCDNTNEYSARTTFAKLGKTIVHGLNPFALFRFFKKK
jgi:hypothetical protein